MIFAVGPEAMFVKDAKAGHPKLLISFFVLFLTGGEIVAIIGADSGLPKYAGWFVWATLGSLFYFLIWDALERIWARE